jgi:glycosyltransferase involved in cell wall biosynthesis
MRDRHGGFSRYGFQLLKNILALPSADRAGVELFVLPWSDRPVLPAAEVQEEEILARPMISPRRHRWQRRLLVGSALRVARIDLFHSLVPGASPLAPGCPMVGTAYDIIPAVLPEPGGGLLGALNRKLDWVIQGARNLCPDHLVAISEVTRQDLLRVYRLNPRRITVTHLGVDYDRFSPSPTTPSPEAEAEAEALRTRHDLPPRYFICVGSDHYRKNHRRLVEAWREASGRIPEGLVFVGRALYQSTLQDLEAELRHAGLLGRFRWLQEVSDDELPALYRGAVALIAPSLYEGFGLTVLEAMACGTPVAAARAGSLPEVGGDAALYFDPLRVEEMKRVMVQLSEDQTLRIELQKRGLERARQFSWQSTARATLAVYRQVLQTGSR